MKLCQWCQKNPVKLPKNKTCSRSCGSSLKWYRMLASKKILLFKRRGEYARRTSYVKRIQAEFERHCRELGIKPASEIRTLYIRARNRGYLNGYSTACRRIRHEKRSSRLGYGASSTLSGNFTYSSKRM